jgi:hypothetical protein
MQVLNNWFQTAGFSFNLVNVSHTINAAWQRITIGSRQEFDMRSSLRKGSFGDLNIYFHSIGGGLAGYAFVNPSRWRRITADESSQDLPG